MKYCTCILLSLFFHYPLWAQPVRPCLNFPVVIDTIQGVGMQAVRVYISKVGIKNPKLDSNGCNEANSGTFNVGCYGIFVAKQNAQGCQYTTNYSTITGKLYLERYNVHEPVLTIESGSKKMYIVFNRMPQFERELFKHDNIMKKINDQNQKLGTPPYYMYIHGITFSEGVFFLKENYREPSGWLKKTEIRKLYEAESNKTGEMLVYSPYKIENGTGYYKTFSGSFSEKQVIELILENQPIENSMNDALGFTKWKLANGFIKQSTGQPFSSVIKKLEGDSRNAKDSLLAISRHLTEDELFEKYNDYRKNDFFSILDEDYSLRTAFSSYFKRQNEVKKNDELYKHSNYKINKQKLKEYYLKKGNHYEEFVNLMKQNQYKVTKEKLQSFITGLNQAKK
jgi:hypothetical protein